jgi:NADH-quinone oxidoreductase subunit L
MHAMGDVIDMRKFSGLRKVLPRTHWLFLVGAATLAGLPVLSAFFSKDTILNLLVKATEDVDYGNHFKLLAVVGFATAFLTAIYTSKAYFRTFWGTEKLPPEAGHHPHDATNAMYIPMIVLAVGSVLAGLVLGVTGILHHYLEHSPIPITAQVEHHESALLMFASALIAVIGVGIGYVWSTMISDEPSKRSQPNLLVNFARERLYIDWLYLKTIVLPAQAIAGALAWFDRTIVNGIATLIGTAPVGLGNVIKPTQSGKVSSYATYTAIGIAALAVYLIAF